MKIIERFVRTKAEALVVALTLLGAATSVTSLILYRNFNLIGIEVLTYTMLAVTALPFYVCRLLYLRSKEMKTQKKLRSQREV